MFIDFTIWTLVGLLFVFVLAGLFLFVTAVRDARREHAGDAPRGLSLRERARRYVGPVSPDMALLNAPARVGIEYVSSLCGFPGFGWLISGRVLIGLLLMSIGPAMVWAVYPVILSNSSPDFGGHPLAVVRYLPLLALASGTIFALVEYRASRRRHSHG